MSRLLPSLHAERHVAIHPVRGQYMGGDTLRLARHSRLTFRLPDERIQLVLRLAGKTLNVGGVHRSTRELETAIRRYIHITNERPKPLHVDESGR